MLLRPGASRRRPGQPLKQPSSAGLSILPYGKPRLGMQKFRLVHRDAASALVRSREKEWACAKVVRLKLWLQPQEATTRPTAALLDGLLHRANKELGHANSFSEARQRARSHLSESRKWHGRLDRDELLGTPGFVVVRKLVDRATCEVLRAAGETFLFRRAKATSRCKVLANVDGVVKVHADFHDEEATLRSVARSRLATTAGVDAAWARVVTHVARRAGRQPSRSNDEALTVAVAGMAAQHWHLDSTASLSYVVALNDGVLATEVLQLDEPWLDSMRCRSQKRRDAFMRRAWAAADGGDAASSPLTLSAGDVIYFYSHRLHRAPPPPSRGKRRYTLFGAFCAEGASMKEPTFAPH